MAPNQEPAPVFHFKEPALRAGSFATDTSLTAIPSLCNLPLKLHFLKWPRQIPDQNITEGRSHTGTSDITDIPVGMNGLLVDLYVRGNKVLLFTSL